MSWRSSHYRRVHGIYSKRLARWACRTMSHDLDDIPQSSHTIHQNIDEEDLHCVQRVAEPKERAQRDQGQRRCCRAKLERQKVLDVMEDRFPYGEAQPEVGPILAILVPSSTAGKMVLKLSSTKIMSAASLATSVPLLPIETPMSAIFNAGASFTARVGSQQEKGSFKFPAHLRRRSSPRLPLYSGTPRLWPSYVSVSSLRTR